ncbi:hypothetical protein [Paenibacillus medicaginis]|uniref:DUF2187 domain-containing protein n=1 Tax=Paenibacillus medicaginis TaxID=1470560 RepID=A0ABV5BV70_9BACL
MGVHQNITANKFPRQGEWLDTDVEVCFHYNTNTKFRGKIIRDDMEEPNRMIIQLEDGRVVLSTECQYSSIQSDEK